MSALSQVITEAQLSQRDRVVLRISLSQGHSWSLKIVPSESLSTVYYSHYIVTVAVSLAVLTQYIT